MMNAQISHGEKKKKKHKNINTMFLSLRSNMDSLNLILDVRKFINEGTEKKKEIAKEECGEQIFEGPKYNGQGHLLRKSKN